MTTATVLKRTPPFIAAELQSVWVDWEAPAWGAACLAASRGNQFHVLFHGRPTFAGTSVSRARANVIARQVPDHEVRVRSGRTSIAELVGLPLRWRSGSRTQVLEEAQHIPVRVLHNELPVSERTLVLAVPLVLQLEDQRPP